MERELNQSYEAAIRGGFISREQAEFEQFGRIDGNYGTKPPDKPMALPQFHSVDNILDLELPPIERICGPLTSAGVTMMAGASGVGKSLFALHMAGHIAAGVDFESWRVPEARRVLYVDGEMAPQYLQGRVGQIPRHDNLQIMHLWLMGELGFYVNLADQRHRDWFLQPGVFDVFDVFIFDTVSGLIQGGPDFDVFHPQYWLQMEPFHQRFRAAGKTVLWIDNLNKKGEVFGTSTKHHKVDAMWLAKDFENKHHDAKAAFVIDQDKLRGDSDEADGIWEYMNLYGWRIRS